MKAFVGEAPGRLDFLGGVADYSGSMVLQTPIAATTKVEITSLGEQVFWLISTARPGAFKIPLAELAARRYDSPLAWRHFLNSKAAPDWTLYVLGCFWLFAGEMQWWPQNGLAFRIDSQVPTSMGVSSSAALEIATLRALENLSGRHFEGTDMAKLAQQAENEVVGAPCGLMDQLAVSHGVPGAVLPIICRPDLLQEPVSLPEGVVIVGWPSGVQHSVADSPYATARTAAFMGKKWLESLYGSQFDYLTQFPGNELLTSEDYDLPELVSGADFLARFEGIDDPLSHIEPGKDYPIRSAVFFAIEEHARCQLSVMRLKNLHLHLNLIGNAMFRSHAGYTSLGLGCPETDAMVDVVGKLGPEKGFYGARVSGGGSGGTVVVLAREEALPLLESFDLVSKALIR